MSNKTREIDGYIRELDHPLEAEIVLIRSIILAANPGITEHIKWNAPSFCFNGEDRITFRLSAKAGIQLVFHRGAKVKDAKDFVFADPAGILEWPAKDRALAKFIDVKDVKSKKAALLPHLVQRKLISQYGWFNSDLRKPQGMQCRNQPAPNRPFNP